MRFFGNFADNLSVVNKFKASASITTDIFLLFASQKTLWSICSDQAVCLSPGPIAMTLGFSRYSSRSCPESTPTVITSGHDNKLASKCSGLVPSPIRPAPENAAALAARIAAPP